MSRIPQLRAIPAIVLAALCVGVLSLAGADAGSMQQAVAKQILSATGVRGGLIVHLGCGDGKLTAALADSAEAATSPREGGRANDSYVVHGLDADAANIDKARKHIQALGLYGKVSVERWDAARLPYADNLVNLLVSSGTWRVASEEVMRVLAPNGVAYTKKNGQWTKTTKPWPSSIDEWTHFLHGPDNNAVARDSVIGPPGHVQWAAGPSWSRDHDVTPSVFGPVSAGGRLFYIQDEGPICVIDQRLPQKRSLVARDAFNGVLLWKRPVLDWYSSRVIWGHIPVHTQRRLVAVGDRVYVTLGLQAAVTELEATTGATVQEYKGTEHTSEIVCDRGLLALVIRKTHSLEGKLAARNHKRFRPGYPGPQGGGQALMVVRADTGERLWRSERSCIPLTLAVSGGRVFFAERQHVVCLDLRSGKELWSSPHAVRTLVVHGNTVLVASGRDKRSKTIAITALSADDGKQLWTARGDCLPNFHFFFAPVDLFVARGLVWGLAQGLEWNTRPGSGHLLGLDLATGHVKTKIPLAGAFTTGHHVRCYKGKATERFLLLNKRGTEFLSLDPEHKPLQCHWVRGACRYGILPSNGLLYAPSHGCVCYPGAQLQGFYALAPASAKATAGKPAAPRLERGPAFSAIGNRKSEIGNANDWPTYRHDAARSGSTPARVSAALSPLWSAPVGQRLTAPTAAEGKVFVAAIDAHDVHALNAATGERVWRYTAGGRVDSPPTIHGGLVLFGCRDGWVYCLRASDGTLVWRFRGAPIERRVGAFGQLESAWPVHGSVLVKDNTLYFAAGRSSFLDGGIHVYGLDVSTGKLRFETRLGGPDPRQTGFVATAGRMPGAVPDILTSDGSSLYMRHVRLDGSLSSQPGPAALSWGVKSSSHLLAGSGFLDDTFFNRTAWQYGRHVVRSQLLVFDTEAAYGLRVYSGISWNCPVFNPGEGYLVFSRALKAPPTVGRARGNRIPYETYRWHNRLPIRVRAMVLASGSRDADSGTSKRLFVAGPPDLIDAKDPLAALESRKRGHLWVLSADDGEKLAEHELESPPIFDGMIAAYGRLYISTQDGNLLCMQGKEWKKIEIIEKKKRHAKRKRDAQERARRILVKPGGLIFSASFDIGRGAKLAYPTKDNFNLPRGSVEFRISPKTNLADRKNHKFFCIGKQGHPNSFQCWKTGMFNDLRFRICDSNKKTRDVRWEDIKDWQVGSWHHILFSWNLDAGRLSLWVDGVKVDSVSGEPIDVGKLGEKMWIGTEDGGGQEAIATIDDLKIYEQEPPSEKPAK